MRNQSNSNKQTEKRGAVTRSWRRNSITKQRERKGTLLV